MSAVKLAKRPVSLMPDIYPPLMRWDMIEVDSGRCAFSFIFDRLMESESDVFRRAVALESIINEGSAT